LQGLIDPVKIAAKREMEIAVTFPYDERRENGIQKAKLHLPIVEVLVIDHSGKQRNENAKRGNKD
jgi:hypothetical protein